MKVVVGMSGGVDSSVTACLLREQGYDVEGLSFILYEARMKNTFAGCCSIESINDARRTAERIGVPHTAVDLREEFMTHVIEPFIAAYAKGITPNPCILCNRHIKFPHLLKFADESKADFIATGHYARTENCQQSAVGGQGKICLKKGIDPKKDQSYVLYVLGQEVLSRLILPLGEKRKDEVREIARALDLPAAKRPESQEICFVEDKDYCKFIGRLLPEERGPGQIVDATDGKVLGIHKGIHAYTIGQRKGLGISSPEPLYVVKIDTRNNTVYAGPKEMANVKEFVLEEVNWLIKRAEGKNFRTSELQSFRASVKVRSMMKDEPATLFLLNDGRVRVVFDEPQWAPAPGQSAVFYDGDAVMGGGIIHG
jgi:tRNA-specific 2-thiouridylase